MAIKIEFDSSGNMVCPNFILMTKGCKVIGNIPKYDVKCKDSMEDASELYFYVGKNSCPEKIWDSLTDFKMAYVPDWDALFELTVELEDNQDGVTKNVTAKSLGEAELSQINVYGLEINTEDDISRDDYKETTLYNGADAEASLLDRLLEKAPHYKIAHVDGRIANIQRTFSFDGKTILDCLREVCEEIQCHLEIFTTYRFGKIIREISLYDLLSYCNDCHERGDFVDSCSKCGGKNISPGYGEDTTIFVSKDNLAEGVQYSSNPDSVKNCFHLEAGDDLMTAAIAACNPNGSSYIWSFSDSMKEDMSSELSQKLREYDSMYKNVSESYEYWDDNTRAIGEKYNEVARKYMQLPGVGTVKEIDMTSAGFRNAVLSYYDALDLSIFLTSTLMPSFEMEETTAEKEVMKVYSGMFTIGVKDLKTCSASSIDSSVLSTIKTIIHFYYEVSIVESSYANGKWSGKFQAKNYSDEADCATSDILSFDVNDDFVNFTKQKIDKILSKAEDGKYDISSIFKLENDDFSNEMHKYCLDSLKALHDICQGCVDVLIQQGASEKSSSPTSQMYELLYVPYYSKLTCIENEMSVRESDVSVVKEMADKLQGQINDAQASLNLQNFLGADLNCELASFRREDSYQNTNYISDGLDNSQLIQNAVDFLDDAEKEIEKSSTSQHQISATTHNLFSMPEFKKMANKFEVGNWIRVMADENVYRLRLLDFEVDFGSPENTTVSFSDVTQWENSVSDVSSIISSASSMATSYGAVMRQARTGSVAKKKIDKLASDGVNASDFKIISDNTGGQYHELSQHGFCCKMYDEDEGKYDDKQLRIINNGIFLTSDSWKSVRTAIGEYRYKNPSTGEIEVMYGINADLLIGNLILGENLVIKNGNGSMSFDRRFTVTNGINTFIVDPSSDKLMRVTSQDIDLLYLDENGHLYLRGDGTNVNISGNEEVKYLLGLISENTDGIKENSKKGEELKKSIDANTSNISNNSMSISTINGRIDSIDSSVAEINNSITSMTARIAKLEEDVAAINKKIG